MSLTARNLTTAFFMLLVVGAISPVVFGSARFSQWLEVVLGGLMSGVLYSLVAIGLVLIFKASGVFNFAQGAMVLMVALAWLIEALVLRRLVNQDPIVLFMATLGVAYFLDGFGQAVWGSDIYT